MSQKTTKKATRRAGARPRMLCLGSVGLTLALLAAFLVALFWMRPRFASHLERELDALGARFESRVEVEDVRFRGRSVTLHGVAVYPLGRPVESPVLRVASISLRFGLASFMPWRGLSQRLEQSHVYILSPALHLVERPGVWSDFRWLGEQARSFRLASPEVEAGSASAPRAKGRRALPAVSVEDGLLMLDVGDRWGGRYRATMGEATLRPEGSRSVIAASLEVDGLGALELQGTLGGPEGVEAGVTLPADAGIPLRLVEGLPGLEDAVLSLTMLKLEESARVLLQDLSMRNLALPMPGASALLLRELKVGELRLRADARSLLVEAPHGEAVLAAREEEGRRLQVENAVLEIPWRESGRRLTFVVREGAESEAAFDVRLDARSRPEALALRLVDMEVFGIAEYVTLPGGGRLLGGRLDGELYWRRASRVERGNARLRVRDGRARIGWISAHEMSGMHLGWTGEWERTLLDGSWHLEPAVVEVGGVEMFVRATRRSEALPDGALAERWLVSGRLPMLEARELQRALPEGFSPILAGLSFEGRVALELDMDIVPSDPERSRFDLFLREAGLALGEEGVIPEIRALGGRRFEVNLGAVGQPDIMIGPEQPGWPDFETLPDHVWRAVLAAEDDRFALHEGFDLRALRNAIAVNLLERDVVRGASTISQQVVKNLFTGGARSIARKLEEVVLTWAMEGLLSKERILQLYLALAHVGPGLYGIDAGARAYFGVPATELQVTESIFIASILGSPERWGRDWLVGELEASRWEKMRNVLRNLERSGVVGPQLASQVRSLLAGQRVSTRAPVLERFPERVQEQVRNAAR